MGCKRDRFEWLLGETHGCMPPERLEMRWTNTFFSQDMDLSREDQQQSNEQQVAAGQPEVSLYSGHAHSLLWPEKITNERLIGRKVVRHADPSLCTPGIQSRLLFMRTHVLGQVAGWLWAGIKGRGSALRAPMHWKLSLQQQVYSNENPAPMLASQGHPAFGQDKNLFVEGRGQAATQDNLMLMKHFFPASMFCCDPCGFREGLRLTGGAGPGQP
ncbi:hypothetical protein WJX84_006845 [Apatococcus fuscideae]